VDITAFVRELLFSHDCVIVPGFGGLIGNYTPARIDKNTFTFHPPFKQISFNRNLNHNDGLLAGRISGSLKINYIDALRSVEEFVTSVRKKLERGEKIVFDNIGSFTNNQEGNIQFEPDRSANYHLGSYGLEMFQFSPLEGYDVRKQITRHIDKVPVHHSSMRKILWRAAVILPLLALMVAVPLKTNLFKPKLETTNLNPLVAVEFENNKKAIDEKTPALPAKTEVTRAQPAEETITTETPPAEPSRITNYNTDGYYLIVGSFKSMENAGQQVNKLKKEGFNPEIISAANGFFRVSAMRCNDLETALSQKENIVGKHPGTWIRKIR